MLKAKKHAGNKIPVDFPIPATTEAALKNLALYWDATQHWKIIPQRILTLLAKAVKDDWRTDARSRQIIGLIANQEDLRDRRKLALRTAKGAKKN